MGYKDYKGSKQLRTMNHGFLPQARDAALWLI